jgi:hypothetical protein
MTINEFPSTTPVRPPTVNSNTKPSAHKQSALYFIRVPYIVVSHLKISIPVGTAIIIVADVKYACVSPSIPTVNMWCAHSTNSTYPTAVMAKIIPRFPNASFFPLSWQMMFETKSWSDENVNFRMPEESE